MDILLSSIWPILKAGLLVTIPLSLIAFAIALVIAVVTALARFRITGFYDGYSVAHYWCFAELHY